jgi:hypothetical protein
MEDRKSKHLKSSCRRIDRRAWVLMRKQPQPIVSPEVQDAAIHVLERSNPLRNATRRTNRFFLLRGLVYCMAPRPDHSEIPCGRRMHGEAPPDRRPFHRCTYEYAGTAEHPGGRCKTKVSAEALEDQVWAWVCGIFTNADNRERLLRDMGLAQQSDALALDEAEAALVAAHRAVEDANAAIDRLIERYEQGKLVEEDYDRLYPKRCEARESARQRLAEAQRKRANALAAGQRWLEVEQFLMDMQAQFEAADDDEKRAKIIRRLVERVEIYPNGRKRIVGTLLCVTGDMPERVANGSMMTD